MILDLDREKIALAAAFRWAARLNFHEGVANHFSLAINADGTRFLMNPNQRHFSRIKASDIIEVDAKDSNALSGPDAPDITAWGLHGGIHRHCSHARCVMHVHSNYATVLASLSDSRLLPVDQNSAMFFNRCVIDEHYGGLALEDEGNRCAALLTDPKKKVMIMGNHGVLVIGATVAETLIASTISSALQGLTSKHCRPGSHCACCLTKLQRKPRNSSKPTPSKMNGTFLSLTRS